MIARDKLDRAINALNVGQVELAESLARDVIKAQPNNADARNTLGAVLFRKGLFEEATESVRQAIRLNPNIAGYYCNLGEIERRLEHLDSAVTALERALVIDPNAIRAYNNLGIVHTDRQDYDRALVCFEKAVGIDPSFADAHNNLGNVLRALQKPEQAIEEYRRAVTCHQNDAKAHSNMGSALRGQKRFDESERAFRRAAQSTLNSVDATRSLASLLFSQKRYDEALRLLNDLLRTNPKDPQALISMAWTQFMAGNNIHAEKAVKAVLDENPNSVDALNLYGQICHELDRYDDALKFFDRALAVEPNNVEALNYYGTVLKSVARVDEARNVFTRALEVSPTSPTALYTYLNMADLERFTPDSPLFIAMREILERASDPEHERFIAVHFAIGKAYEDMEDYEAALNHYRIGAQQKRAQLTYREADLFMFLEEVRRTFTAEYFQHRPFSGRQSMLPIFIVGMERSGSTLIEQIISSHPSAHGAGEINTLGASIDQLRREANLPQFPAMVRSMRPAQFEVIADRYLAAIAGYSETATRVTDKQLTNYYYVGLIHTLFPNAKIIHTARNPVDTCLSSYTKLFSAEIPHSYDLRELGRYYGKYRELIQHWRTVLPPGVMIDVRYEDVVASPEVEARRILAFCGLEWDERCLKFYESDRPVKTASMSEVRKPLYATSVERWRRYGAGLDPLLETLRQSGVNPDV